MASLTVELSLKMNQRFDMNYSVTLLVPNFDD